MPSGGEGESIVRLVIKIERRKGKGLIAPIRPASPLGHWFSFRLVGDEGCELLNTVPRERGKTT